VSSSVPSATLDTNVPVEYWRDQQRKNVVAELLDLAREGRVDLAICRRVRDDVPDEPLRSRLDELPELRIAETGKPAVLGEWLLDVDFLGSDEFVRFLGSEDFADAERPTCSGAGSWLSGSVRARSTGTTSTPISRRAATSS
jgi:hypothetical protein